MVILRCLQIVVKSVCKHRPLRCPLTHLLPFTLVPPKVVGYTQRTSNCRPHCIRHICSHFSQCPLILSTSHSNRMHTETNTPTSQWLSGHPSRKPSPPASWKSNANSTPSPSATLPKTAASHPSNPSAHSPSKQSATPTTTSLTSSPPPAPGSAAATGYGKPRFEKAVTLPTRGLRSSTE